MLKPSCIVPAILFSVLGGTAIAQTENDIWQVDTGVYVTEAALQADLATARYVLLGETHDNPVHHDRQARLLRGMIDAGRRPALVWEMVDRDMAADLAAAVAAGDAAAMGPALDWEARGWPDWEFYRPIADIALTAGLPQAAGNLPRAAVSAMGRAGRAGLPETLATALALPPIPAPIRRRLADELFESHCQVMPRATLDPFVDIQFARDAVLALSMAQADRGDGAVLITGSLHARYGAVPQHLPRYGAQGPIRVVLMVERDPDRPDPHSYAADFVAGGKPADYLWFSPRQAREDPCEALRARFKNRQ